ncbi:hypothetical protein DL93DRAFT_2082797 [Clavulina sp. PMI_390]|nr:hypothetical protein DL93DRAFT_2082797 [Clavulina sp. PMI_390]
MRLAVNSARSLLRPRPGVAGPSTWAHRAYSTKAPESQPAPSLNTDPQTPGESTDPESLPVLPRPLGVLERPSTTHGTWTDQMWNQSSRLENRRVLIKQATQGYFHDYNRLGGLEGKTWIAPKSLIREDHALYFPDIEGHRLDPREAVHTTDLCVGKTSVVAFLTTRSSEEHVESLTKRLVAHTDPSRYQFIQINLQENPLKSMLVSLFVRTLKNQVPQSLHSTYILANQNMEMLREPLGMENKHVGYVYLVDRNCKIRWGGCGKAAPGEAESLERCATVLLNRDGAKTSKNA